MSTGFANPVAVDQILLLGVEETVQIVVEAADAIAEAHALGIIHCDLEPANLFLANRRDNRRVIKVLDFGISKIENADDTTKTGTMLGSPKYMSPEQMMSRRDVDGRADIWALGERGERGERGLARAVADLADHP